MSYTKTTNFAIKDTYLTGNPAKIVKGAEIDAEFDAIAAEDALNLKDSDVQTSSVDTTAGQLLTVGAFGLGATTDAPVIVNLDTTASLPSGSYRFSNGVSLGTIPTGAAANGTVLVERFSTTIVKETWTDVVGGSAANPRAWVRTSYAADTWGAWQEVFVSGSIRLAYGVAASAWSGSVASLDLSSAGIASNSAVTASLSQNLYYDGTNWRTKYTGASARIQMFNDSINVANAPSVSAGSVASLVDCFGITSSNRVLAFAPAGMGYGTGAGGTVTQGTSKATTVTLNKPCGQITMHAASLAANTTVSFTLDNSLLAATDMVLVTPNWGANPGAYQAWCTSNGAGGCIISVRNMTAGALSDALLLNFQIHKGVTA